MKKIKYIIHYDINNDEGRIYALSAKNKVDYIFGKLVENGYSVDVISSSLISAKKYAGGSKSPLSKNINLTKLPAFKWGNLFEKIMAYIWSNTALFMYLLTNVKKGETIIAYHSLAIMKSLFLAKKIKGFKIILEVEEIYNDVIQGAEYKKLRELKYISKADKYIFPTELLNYKVNVLNKPHITIHGTYRAEYERGVSFGDDKIHIVYSGTFDPRKGGAAAAVAAAEFLPPNYHIHILGFGSREDERILKRKIEEVKKKNGAKVTYDGLISGEEYICFLQKCRIGLSTQNPDAAFNNTSFPSKILSYMANGLQVVTIRIPAISGSAVGRDVCYYDRQTPAELAKAILAVDLTDGYDTRGRIRELDAEFARQLEKFMDL